MPVTFTTADAPHGLFHPWSCSSPYQTSKFASTADIEVLKKSMRKLRELNQPNENLTNMCVGLYYTYNI